MGQAKKKREALRKELLARGAIWDFPATVWEAEVVKKLLNEPVLRVPRAPANMLKAMSLKTNECHEICRWYAKNDPQGESKHISGWWAQGSVFVLHSVIQTGGHLICITPSEL